MSDEKLIGMFNDVISEIDRQGDKTNQRLDSMDKRFDQIERKLDDHSFQLEQLHHEVNACKLNLDTTGLLLQKVTELEKRVEHLEQAG